MKKILFLDACISTHESRTKRLCEEYLRIFLEKNPDYSLETVVLRSGTIAPWTAERLRQRDSYIAKGDWDHEMFALPKQYRDADRILVGTPYWDLSFASILKVYIENIMVGELTFSTTDSGFKGLCKGEKLTYITTAGGFIGERNYGYDYLCGIAEMTGIGETEFFSAEGLDLVGADRERIMREAIEKIRKEV